MSSKPKKSKSASEKQSSRPRNFIDPRLVKAMGHPVRNDALSILNERVASPNEISKELGESVGHVSYHIKVLKECDCIELVDTAPRRGAMEHYYRATARAFLSDEEWERLPDSIRPGLSASLLRTMINDATEALKSGSLDRRKDRHMSWTPMIVDEQGWGDITKALEQLLERAFEIQAESAERLAKANEEGVPVTVAALGFEAAGPHRQRVTPEKD
ncbi:MAG TPA: winged helix-turn-helix domain-containing protein [Solirubrobacterales bacterium]|nr:winged helix-turn-helix domain-containing protein [Solirubrobacterales bacterium]